MNKTLTRADLAEAIYSKVGISKVESSDIVDQIFSISDKHVKEVPRKPTQYDDILPNYQSAYDVYNKNR